MTDFTMVPIESIDFVGINREVENRHDGKDMKQALEELASSIKEQGILQPLGVRVSPFLGRYELIYGHRRLAAAVIAGLTEVPCKVLVVEDDKIAELRLIENLHRKDLDPVDEALMIYQLASQGLSAEAIGANLGKSHYYVFTRLRLSQARPETLKLVNRIPLGHVLELAKLPADVQSLAAKDTLEWDENRYEALPDLTGFKRWLNEEYLRDLSKATWKKDDAQLVPEAGSCLACPKRTGFEPTLFPEEAKGKDRCLDAVCFQSKREAILRVNLEKAGPTVLKVTTEYNNRAGMLMPHEIVECKKKDPDAQQAIRMTGPDMGRLFYCKPVARHVSGKAAREALPEAEQAKLKADRKKELYARKLAAFSKGFNFNAVIDKIIDQILKGKGAPDPVFRVALRIFFARTWGITGKALLAHRGIDDYEKYLDGLDKTNLAVALFELAFCGLLSSEYHVEEKELFKTVGLDPRALEKDAKEAYAQHLLAKGGARAQKASKGKAHSGKSGEAVSALPDEGGAVPESDGEDDAG